MYHGVAMLSWLVLSGTILMLVIMTRLRYDYAAAKLGDETPMKDENSYGYWWLVNRGCSRKLVRNAG